MKKQNAQYSSSNTRVETGTSNYEINKENNINIEKFQRIEIAYSDLDAELIKLNRKLRGKSFNTKTPTANVGVRKTRTKSY